MTKAISRPRRRSFWLALPACLILALPPAALAQATALAPATLSPKAQAALTKGLEAAKEQKWESAIKSFQDARKLSPNTPEIYYDLGLAESKIPGREIRAIAWFSAYLLANPNAPNAAAINEKIIELYKIVRNNTSRLIGLVQDTALRSSLVLRAVNLIDVVNLRVRAHDFPAALTTADLIQDTSIRHLALHRILSRQATDGDIAGAKRTFVLMQEAASLIQDPVRRAEAEDLNKYIPQQIADAMAGTAEVKKQKTPRDNLVGLLSLLDDEYNAPAFLDLTGYLKSLPSDDPQRIFEALNGVATHVVSAQNDLTDWPGSVLKVREGNAGDSSGR
jgi:hypothetical protein